MIFYNNRRMYSLEEILPYCVIGSVFQILGIKSLYPIDLNLSAYHQIINIENTQSGPPKFLVKNLETRSISYLSLTGWVLSILYPTISHYKEGRFLLYSPDAMLKI